MLKKLVIFIIIAALAYYGYQYFTNQPLEETPVVSEIEDWPVYGNEEHGYSLKYPEQCAFGSLSVACKQDPPEERFQECLCFLNAQDPNSVFIQTYTGTKPDLNLASFRIFHSASLDYYNPGEGADIVEWVNTHFAYENIPDEANMEIGGVDAVKVYTPSSGMVYSQEDIYFIKDGKLFQISMLDVDDEGNRKLYDNLLDTISF